MAEKTKIDRKDIRVGDKILAVVDRDDVLTTTEGVVHTFAYLGGGPVPTSGAGWAIGSNTHPTQYFLVERPRKELPPAGTWIRIREVEGDSVPLPEDNSYHVGLVVHHNLVETLDYAYVDSEILDFEVIEFVTR